MSAQINITPLRPGGTMHIGSREILSQVQHKHDRIEIVDHLDKGARPVKLHLVTTVDANGKISYEWA